MDYVDINLAIVLLLGTVIYIVLGTVVIRVFCRLAYKFVPSFGPVCATVFLSTAVFAIYVYVLASRGEFDIGFEDGNGDGLFEFIALAVAVVVQTIVWLCMPLKSPNGQAVGFNRKQSMALVQICSLAFVVGVIYLLLVVFDLMEPFWFAMHAY